MNIGEFQNRFAAEIEICLKMLSEDYLKRKLSRIVDIYNSCEADWESNLNAFNGRPIKYLMICEAAPMPKGDQPISYFYNLKNYKTPLFAPIFQAFTGIKPDPNQDYSIILERLQGYGFLLVDTLPFALNYSTLRNKTLKGIWLFDQLVALSCKSYLLPCLANPKINWADDVKVAFQFTVNARAVMESLDYRLVLPGSNQEIVLSEELIATDSSGFRPDMNKLKDLYELDQEGISAT